MWRKPAARSAHPAQHPAAAAGGRLVYQGPPQGPCPWLLEPEWCWGNCWVLQGCRDRRWLLAWVRVSRWVQQRMLALVGYPRWLLVRLMGWGTTGAGWWSAEGSPLCARCL